MVQPAAIVRPLTDADIAACVELSRSARWNQNEADWRMMLALGHGWGIDARTEEAELTLAASALVIPYQLSLETQPDGAGPATGGFAWISMVLVLPQFQRRGFATLLLRHALADLQAARLVPVLDATPAGYPVYLQQGFAPAWGFRRYRRESTAPELATRSTSLTRVIQERDWPEVMAFDFPAFGADRQRLLRRLAARMPQAARIAEQDGRITGFVFGRDGTDATQIGPLVAESAQVAQHLMNDALAGVAGPVQVDLADRYLALLEGLVASGFVLQRPFTRMTPAGTPPGNPDRIVLVAGPELG